MSVKTEAALEKWVASPREELGARGSGSLGGQGSGGHTALLHKPAGPRAGTAGLVGAQRARDRSEIGSGQPRSFWCERL